MTLDLERLRVFAEVVQQGSFTRAAQRLRLQQPTVSHQIAVLEREVGTRLLERLAKGIRLTPAGEALLPYARQAPALVADGLRAAREAGDLASRSLTLGCAETPATYLLPGLLRAMRRRSPPIEVRLLVGNAERVRAAALAGDIDLALLSDRDRHPLLVGEGMVADQFVAIVSPDDTWATRDSVTATELATRYVLLRESGAGTRAFADAAFRAAGIHPAETLEVAGVEALKRLAEAGVGVAIVPRIAVAREEAAGYLRVITLDVPDVAIGYLCLRHKDKIVSPAMQQFALIFSTQL